MVTTARSFERLDAVSGAVLHSVKTVPVVLLP